MRKIAPKSVRKYWASIVSCSCPLGGPKVLLRSNQFNMTAVSVNGSILKLVWTSERSNPVQNNLWSRVHLSDKAALDEYIQRVGYSSQPKSPKCCRVPRRNVAACSPGFSIQGAQRLWVVKPMMSLTPAILFSIMALGSFSTSRFLYSRYSTRAFALIDFGLLPALPP